MFLALSLSLLFVAFAVFCCLLLMVVMLLVVGCVAVCCLLMCDVFVVP